MTSLSKIGMGAVGWTSFGLIVSTLIGPVIGIISTFLTAVFFAHLLLDNYVNSKNAKELPFTTNLTKNWFQNVNFNFDIFKAFTEGYLEGARCFLTPIEIENLPYATALFPYMQTVRFFADYINGDTYFKVTYPEHNLIRTRNQFRLLQCVEEAFPKMEEFIKSQL